MKKYLILAWAVLTILMIAAVYIQGRKIQRLENRLLLERVNNEHNRIVVEVIPRKLNKIAPKPADKAELGDRLYGGEQ